MNYRTLVAVVLGVLCFATTAYGQQKVKLKKEPQDRYLTLSAYTQSYALPSYRLVRVPLSPGLQLGYEQAWKDLGQSEVRSIVEVGYFYHPNLMQSAYVTSGLRLHNVVHQALFQTAFYYDVALQLGYMHSILAEERYEWADDGSLQAVPNLGRPRAVLPASITMGYAPRRGPNLDVFAKYQLMVEAPFANGIPVMLHSTLHVGTRFNLPHKTQKDDPKNLHF